MSTHPRSVFSKKFHRLALCLIGCFVVPLVQAQQVVHVPADQPTLQSAINSVSNGGVIELADGRYTAPAGGFTIYDVAVNNSFTVRGAAGATVVLSGGGAFDIIRFGNPPNSVSHSITFQNLTFADGSSRTDAIGGAFTMNQANARFISCSFQNNAANGPNFGGGAFWLVNSSVSFEQCTWTNNSSHNYGAAISALNSNVALTGCSFVGNRVNLPNHSQTSHGGAIFNSDSTVRVNSCRFENNQAGYVGGAIFCGGTWKDPQNVPSATLVVNNSLFVGNSVAPDPSVRAAAAPLGGAIHLEDKVTGSFFNCRFLNNTARQGGAISSYRAAVDISESVFDGNAATGSGPGEGFGGAIFADSNDIPDSSTNNGTLNRRSVVLTVRDTLFRGPANGSPAAIQGGAIFAGGDTNAAYGVGGIAQNGTEESNRATVNLTRVVFADIATNGSSGLPGSGAAISGSFTALKIDNSLIENCSASGDGGAMKLAYASTVSINQSTIARCTAGVTGGGMVIYGSTLNMNGTNLVNNHLAAGRKGSALTTGPSRGANGVPDKDMEGLIQNCVFSDNSGGAAIYDSDRPTAPFNRLQYSANQFFSPSDPPYISDGVGSKSVGQLNDLMIARSSGPSPTDKAPSDNFAPPAAPIVGTVILVPRSTALQGAPGETLPLRCYLGFAAEGGSVTLDKAPQHDAGLLSVSSDSKHTLTVGVAPSEKSFSTAPLQQAAANISTRLPVGTDQNVLIGGFIITPKGGAAKRVLVRAIGPSLPVAGALLDPTLELHDHTGAIVAQNDNWRSAVPGPLIASDQAFDIQSTGAAPRNDAESALIVTLKPYPETYTAVVRGSNNTTGIALVEVFDLDAVQASTLTNISTRGFVQTGDNVMIGGFIVLGGGGTTKVVVRAIGPSLAPAIANALADPLLELHNAQGTTVETNDDWGSSPQSAQLQASGLAPTNTAESAIYRTDLPRGAYTAVVRGKNRRTGVALVEVYVFQ